MVRGTAACIDHARTPPGAANVDGSTIGLDGDFAVDRADNDRTVGTAYHGRSADGTKTHRPMIALCRQFTADRLDGDGGMLTRQPQTAADRHAEDEATWGVYQAMIAAYREPDRAKGKTRMQQVIDPLSSGVPAVTTCSLSAITSTGVISSCRTSNRYRSMPPPLCRFRAIGPGCCNPFCHPSVYFAFEPTG